MNQSNNKDNKKAKKSLFAKKELPAWKKELKEKNKRDPLTFPDYCCWTAFIICILIGLLPLLIRNFDTSYDGNLSYKDKINEDKKSNEKSVEKRTLTCTGNKDEANYSYTISITNEYENAKIVSNDIEYKVTLKSDATISIDDAKINEYEDISAQSLKGVTTTYTSGTGEYHIIVNYKENSALYENEYLLNHRKDLSIQRSEYEGEEGMSCTVTKIDSDAENEG